MKKTIDKKIHELYEKSSYLRNRSFLCDTNEQTNRIREEQKRYYQEWVFLTKLRDEMSKNKNKELEDLEYETNNS